MNSPSFARSHKDARTEDRRRLRVMMDARARAFLSALLHPLRGPDRWDAMRSAAQHLKQQVAAEFGEAQAVSLFGSLAKQAVDIELDERRNAAEEVFARCGIEGLKIKRIQDEVRA